MVKILSDFGCRTLAPAECTQTSCQIGKKKNRAISIDSINKIIFTNIRCGIFYREYYADNDFDYQAMTTG